MGIICSAISIESDAFIGSRIAGQITFTNSLESIGQNAFKGTTITLIN